MIWQLTPEGRSYATTSSVFEMLQDGPMEGMDIVKGTGMLVETVKQHLDYGVKQGWIVKSESKAGGAQPSEGTTVMADIDKKGFKVLGEDYLSV